MPIRTTEEKVREIIETDSSIKLEPFIQSASTLVDRCCADKDYTETELELIERWLAAHFYCIRDPRTSSESVGTVKEQYQYQVGLHLDVSVYGQTAMVLDYYGGLAALNKSIENGGTGTAWVKWMGKDE